MQLCAFVFLEDISEKLLALRRNVPECLVMDPTMREAYGELEDDIREGA